jgi:hypothetical protein
MVSTAGVGSDDEEGNMVGIVLLKDIEVGDQVQSEGTADGNVNQAETVIAGLNVEEWPRLTVPKQESKLQNHDALLIPRRPTRE